jgi:hypothetical protein
MRIRINRRPSGRMSMQTVADGLVERNSKGNFADVPYFSRVFSREKELLKIQSALSSI